MVLPSLAAMVASAGAVAEVNVQRIWCWNPRKKDWTLDFTLRLLAAIRMAKIVQIQMEVDPTGYQYSLSSDGGNDE